MVLKRQVSYWAGVAAVVSQGSILDYLLFFIHINYLSDEFGSNVKIFADDTSSLFSVGHDKKYLPTN